MDTVLLRAILAMDSYNQGYGAGITGVGSQIGEATLLQDSSIIRDSDGNRLDQAIGFYAAAYKLDDGSTVISYRGTDNKGLTTDPVKGGSDPLNGYGVKPSKMGASAQAAAVRRSASERTVQVNSGSPCTSRT